MNGPVGILLFIPAILVLYALAALIAGSEAALFSLKPHDYDRLGARGPRIRQLLEKPRRLLIVILFANLLVNTLSASLAESLAEHFLGTWGVPVAILTGGFMLLVFGEVTPQTFALRQNVAWSRLAYPFVRVLQVLGMPVVAVFFPLTKHLTRRFESAPGESVTEEDIRHLVSHSEDEGALDRAEERWIHSIFELDRKKAVDVMVPKEKIVALPKETDVAAALEVIRSTRYSRIPLYAGTLDQIVGVLYARDLLTARVRGQDARPARIAREPVFVPRWRRCDLLLNELRARKTHFAVVVDEFGSTAGIVTLETILEAIVGKIRDRAREARP